MRTQKHNQRIIDLIRTLLFIFAIIIFSSCKKNEDVDFLLRNEWKIKSISIDNKSLKPLSETFREEAYILKFIDDSSFVMNTSVNYAGGRYKIVSEEHIFINNYQEWTEVYNALEHQRNFDKQLLTIFTNINSYSCKNKKLTFFAGKNKVIFDKQ